jgi:hypothetical protein
MQKFACIYIYFEVNLVLRLSIWLKYYKRYNYSKTSDFFHYFKNKGIFINKKEF